MNLAFWWSVTCLCSSLIVLLIVGLISLVFLFVSQNQLTISDVARKAFLHSVSDISVLLAVVANFLFYFPSSGSTWTVTPSTHLTRQGYRIWFKTYPPPPPLPLYSLSAIENELGVFGNKPPKESCMYFDAAILPHSSKGFEQLCFFQPSIFLNMPSP